MLRVNVDGPSTRRCLVAAGRISTTNKKKADDVVVAVCGLLQECCGEDR